MREDALALFASSTQTASLVQGQNETVTIPNTKAGRKANYVYVSAVNPTGTAVTFRARCHVAGVDATTEGTVPLHSYEGKVLYVGGAATLLVFNPSGAAANATICVSPLEWD